MKRGVKDSILVELEKLSENEFSFSSGVKLYVDTSYKPEWHVRIYGECVLTPEVLTKSDQIKYVEGDYRYIDSIEPEVKVGDRVYFTYISADKRNIVEYNKKCYCKIPYSSILCVVRKGIAIDIVKATDYCKENNLEFNSVVSDIIEKKIELPFSLPHDQIIPIGGNIMLEEYYGEDAESVDVDGKKVFGKVSASGLITGIAKPSSRHGVVRIVGSPLKGDDVEVEAGDIVMFPDKFGFKNNIEGKDYLFVKYWDIQAIVGKENEISPMKTGEKLVN
jgi:co-chaperonin GroES (HSP10)